MSNSTRSMKNFVHSLIAYVSTVYFQFPTKDLTVIGVTGTDGKTTTANLIYHILTYSNIKCGLVSTVGVLIGDTKKSLGFHVTTPPPFKLQKYCRLAKKAGCKVLVLEVTSHAIDQNRILGIHFDIGVLTNVTHEHLDYHKSYLNYLKTKVRLLKKSKSAIVNYDDESYDYVSHHVEKDKLVTYSLADAKADITLKNFTFTTTLLGDFNKYNILAASAVAKKLGIKDSTITEAIKSFSPPKGRQEILYRNGFTVIVDFAHTPNAFERILPEVRKMISGNGRLIHVFGAAGRRDATKREKMGHVSSQYSDIIILTSEDPRDEPVRTINQQIASGFKKEFIKVTREEKLRDKMVYFEIDDRKKAMEEAVMIAREGDVILASGKGHEESINYGNGEMPWSEHDVLAEAIKKKNGI